MHFLIFDLAVKKSRSTEGHHLNNLSSTQVPNATYLVPRPSVIGSGEDFLKVFTTYGHGGHLGHVTYSFV